MKNDVIDVRNLIKNKMEFCNYDYNDMKKRLKSYSLFQKFMQKEALLTIQLATQIGIVLDIDPLYIVKEELKYMDFIDPQSYKVHNLDMKRIEKIMNQMRKKAEETKPTKTDMMYLSLEKLYNNCIKNGDISSKMTFEEFKNWYHQILKISNLKYLNLNKFGLDYEELDLYQVLSILFWIKNAEKKIVKNRRKIFNRNVILMNLDEVLELKNAKNDDELKEKIYQFCEKRGITVTFEKGLSEDFIDGFCKWKTHVTPLIIIKDKENIEENFKEFVILFSHIMSDSQKLDYYDTKLINFGEDYDNYIHDYQIIKANQFMEDVLKIKIER